MEIGQKIKKLRESKQLTQAQMATRLNIEPSTYAKMERGETDLKYDRLQRIADIFDMSITELINYDGADITILAGDNYGQCQYARNFYADSTVEIEKLKLSIQHKDELLAQKDKQIELLENLLSALKK